MININACSLISGRSLYYDVYAIYFHRDNWYKINKDDVNYTFVPLK